MASRASRLPAVPAGAVISQSGAGETYVINRDGERIIPASLRADGSIRKAIKVRPGFIPEEERQRYVSKGQKVRQGVEQARICPPGSEGLVESMSGGLNSGVHNGINSGVHNLSSGKKSKRKSKCTKNQIKEPLFTFEEPTFGEPDSKKTLNRSVEGEERAVVEGIAKLNIDE